MKMYDFKRPNVALAGVASLSQKSMSEAVRIGSPFFGNWATPVMASTHSNVLRGCELSLKWDVCFELEDRMRH